jgi:hypothetical protein
MFNFKRSVLAAALLGCVLVSTSAQAAIASSSFWFDPDGNAFTNNSVLIDADDGFSLGGKATIIDTFATPFDLTGPGAFNPLNPNAFTFTQTGDVGFGYLDTNSFLVGLGVLSINGFGTGTTNGVANYTGGTVTFKNSSLNPIATFNITGGTAGLDGVVPGLGGVRLSASETSVTPGYFFQDVGGVQGADFYSFEAGKPVFAVSDTDLSRTSTTYNIVDGKLVGVQIVGNVGGQMYLEIPEPESLALFGVGLLALAASRRRKAAK